MPLSLFKPLTEPQYRRWHYAAPWFMLGGLTWLGVHLAGKTSVGLATAFQAAIMGLAWLVYLMRHREKGVWMVAVMVWVFAALIVVLHTFASLGKTPRVMPPTPTRDVLDQIGAVILMTWTARASWTVIKQNRTLR